MPPIPKLRHQLVIRCDPRVRHHLIEDLLPEEGDVEEPFRLLLRHQIPQIPLLPCRERLRAHQSHEIEDVRLREVAEEPDLDRRYRASSALPDDPRGLDIAGPARVGRPAVLPRHPGRRGDQEGQKEDGRDHR